MIHQFEISCKECGARGFYDPENNGIIKIYFEKGSQSIMDRIVVCCSKCGGKQEAGIYWPLDTNAVLTNAMHSDGEDCIHCDSGEDIPPAFNYCPYCNKKLSRR